MGASLYVGDTLANIVGRVICTVGARLCLSVVGGPIMPITCMKSVMLAARSVSVVCSEIRRLNT